MAEKVSGLTRANGALSANRPFFLGSVRAMTDKLTRGRPHTWEQTGHEIADLMSTYWVDFATHGDPNGESLPPWREHARETD